MILRRGSCFRIESLCCSFLSLFPKVFVLATLTWALWGILTELRRNTNNGFAIVTVLLTTITLYILSIYTYFKVISVGPGSPLEYPELKLGVSEGSEETNITEVNGANETSEQSERLLNPRKAPPMEILVSHTVEKGETCLRWCGKCHVWKPDRCHHCSSCKTCFLRMDHHCPWFSCCIGFKNHKFFVQFLLYVFSFCGVVFICSAYLLYLFFKNEQYQNDQYLSLTLVFLAVVSLAFFICVGVFAAFLIYMLLQNLTTIEFQDLRWNYLGDHSAEYVYDSHGKKKKVSNFYDLGVTRNWMAIMGKSWYQWLLPVAVTDEDLRGYNNGINFEVDEEVFDAYCQNLRLQDRLNEQLQQYGERLRGRRT